MGDWTFGKGANDYKTGVSAIAQSIQTRLFMFLNDCFFATESGVDWWNLLGAKDQTALNLAVSACILNTNGVTGISQLSINLDLNRNLTIKYAANTVTGTVSNFVILPFNFLLTEDGSIFETEGGQFIVLEGGNT